MLARRAPQCAARSRHHPDRRPGPPRQRPAPHEPGRSGLRPGSGRLCRRRRRALSMARVLHPGQRDLHHGALCRPVRRVVPARPRRPNVHPGIAQSVPRNGAVDARDPRRQSRCQARPDRRPRQDLQHARTERRRRVLQRTPLAGLGLAVRYGRPRSPPLELPAAQRRRCGRHSLVPRQSLPARHHRRQLLRHQRALARSSPRALSGAPPRHGRRHPVRRRRSLARAGHAHARHRPAAARDLGTLRHPAGHHRSAHRQQPRRPDALAA